MNKLWLDKKNISNTLIKNNLFTRNLILLIIWLHVKKTLSKHKLLIKQLYF